MQKRNVLFLIFFLLVSCTVSENNYSDDYFTAKVTVTDSEFLTKTGTSADCFIEGDVIGIIPFDCSSKVASASQMLLTYTGLSSSVASFTSGLGWSMMADKSFRYVAYFPYQEEYRTTGMVLDYSNQVQTGNNDDTHISDYDFLYSDAVFPSSPTEAELQMKHLSALSKFTFTVPEEYKTAQIKTLSIIADSAIFVRKGVCDISSIAESVKPSFTSESYSRGLNMKFINVTPDGNKKVVAYMMMAPADVAGKTLTVNLWTKEGKCLSGNIVCDADQEGGNQYEYSVNLSDSGLPSLPEKPRPGEKLSILIVGHSLSVDATEYLPDLLNAAGISNVDIGRFYSSNASLKNHYDLYVNDAVYQSYFYCYGGKTDYSCDTYSPTTLKTVIRERYWDMVFFQQSVGNQGAADYSTYQPYLNDLLELVRDEFIDCYGMVPFMGWHMHWAFGSDYDTMLVNIKDATQSMMSETGINKIVSTATAYDNAKKTTLGDISNQIYGDGWCHSSLGVGRYLGSCTWFESIIKPIYGVSVVGNTFRMTTRMTTNECDAPATRYFYPVTDDNATILQKCAEAAAEKPFETTVITQ